MSEHILDVVFEDDEVIFSNFLGYELGKVHKTTNMWGKDRHVEYCDEFGHVLSSAREISPLFGGTPYVEFYDKDNKPVGRAYVTNEILPGRRKVEYTTNAGKTVATRYVDEEKVQRNETARKKKAEEKEKAATSSRQFDASTPMVLCALAFLGVGLSALFSFLHSHIHTIIHYARAISIYGVCPLMVVLHLLLCRTKGAKIFRLVHLLLYTAGFAALAYMMNCLYADQDYAFVARMSSTTLAGLLSMFASFAPTLVLGFVSGIWTLICKKRDGHRARVEISRRSMNLMWISNLILVSVSMSIMLFYDAYGSGGFSGVFGTIVLQLFLLLLLALAFGISYLPYKLCSNKF